MSTSRLRAPDRAPSALPVAIGHVVGHRLAVDKVSRRDGSGKCDIEECGDAHARVEGVVFRISEGDRSSLDRAEGFGHGYLRKVVEVDTESGRLQAVAYYATDKDKSLRPLRSYMDYVISGAVEHGLSAEYVGRLRNIQTVPDSSGR